MKKLLLALGVSVAALSVQAHSQVAPTPEAAAPQVLDTAEALAVDAKIYAAAYGVPVDEAIRRLSVMTGFGPETAAETGAEGADFAGAYFDNASAEFGLMVRSKRSGNAEKLLVRRGKAGPSKAQKEQRRAERRALRSKAGISDGEVEAAEDILASDLPVKVKKKGGAANSLRELKAELQSNADKLRSVPGLQTTYVDQKTGEIVLMVAGSDSSAARAAASAFLKAPFRIDLVPGKFKDVSIRGGDFTVEQSRQYCMTAFAARRTSDSKTGVVTAGHCASPNPISIRDDNGSLYTLTQSGIVNNGTTMDLMFLSGTPTGVAQFYYDNSGYVRSVTGTRSRASTTDGNGTYTAASTVPGSFICHLGQKTLGSSIKAQSCGEVISVDGNRSTGAMTGGNYVIVRNTQSGAGTIRTSGTGTLICFEGDSGGPVFANTIAYGVTSACLWANNATSSPADGTALYLMYTSVDYFPSIGVSILVQ